MFNYSFSVGSVMAVTFSDIHAPGKKSRFVGICIQRTGCGLRANFTLRNVVDGQGKLAVQYKNIIAYCQSSILISNVIRDSYLSYRITLYKK